MTELPISETLEAKWARETLQSWPAVSHAREVARALLSLQSKLTEVEAELNETWTDEKGTVWARPTAWAYAKVCNGRNTRAEKAEAERDALRERVGRYEAALKRFAVHGIPRIDHTPTRLLPRQNDAVMASEDFWQSYFNSANENVKEDARAALDTKETDRGD